MQLDRPKSRRRPHAVSDPEPVADGRLPRRPAAPADAAEPGPAPALAVVRTMPVQRATIAADLIFTGDIQAQSQVNAAFRTSGKIATRLD